MKDPDPFEERHPSRIDPECPFGMILKSFFKKDNLVSDIFSSYMKDNYFTQKGLVITYIFFFYLIEMLKFSDFTIHRVNPVLN